MKNNKHRRFLLTFIIVVTLYLFDTVHATAAAEAPNTVSENELPAEPITVSENELPVEPITVSENMQPAAPAAESDCISSAAELTDWLSSHMCGGGRARLTANITLDSSYLFMPYPNMPPLFVETDGFTIFVSADVQLWSDRHLNFSGAGNAQGIFHVEKGGSLLLDGVTVEMSAENGDSSYALWQEEGASLTVGNTFAASQITGNIHYADTPLVTDTDSVCVIVEKGQSLDGQLPAEIMCRVNYQGSYLEHVPIAVSWDMTGTKKQQDERQRFQTQGVFCQAHSHENPVCTVVYHDYPLTFTRADALIRQNAYTFQGDYIKQEEALSAVISPEYSFDGINWIREGEHNTLSAESGFYISFPCNQWDTAVHPHIHIRLRAEAEGQVYYSNMLRYTADHLDVEEDLGGSRGGGTNVVDPPADPAEQEKSDKPEQPEKSDKTNPPKQQEEPKEPAAPQNQADTSTDALNQTVEPSAQPDWVNGGNLKDDTVTIRSDAVTSTPKSAAAEQPTENDCLLTENILPSPETSSSKNDYFVSLSKEAAPIKTVPDKQDQVTQNTYESTAPARQTKTLILAAGFVLLSAAAGATCFFVHTGKGGIHKRKPSSSGGTKR